MCYQTVLVCTIRYTLVCYHFITDCCCYDNHEGYDDDKSDYYVMTIIMTMTITIFTMRVVIITITIIVVVDMTMTMTMTLTTK